MQHKRNLETPNLDAFRAFLKTRPDQKRRGTCGTAGTGLKSTPYQFHGLGTCGTPKGIEDQEGAEALERQAFVEIDGHVPPIFSLAFIALQTACPANRTPDEWRTAVNDAGLFLDSFGKQAAALGWQAHELFEPNGLVWALQGATVTALISSTATLSDGRTFMCKE